MGRALMQGKSIEVSISLDEYRARNAFVWDTQDLAAARCGVKILDPLPYLCRGGRCEGDVQGQPVYIDDDHLSERGGDLLVPMFRQVFNQLQPGDPSALPTRAHEEVAHLPPSDQSASPP
jgi:hypothetical protein